MYTVSPETPQLGRSVRQEVPQTNRGPKYDTGSFGMHSVLLRDFFWKFWGKRRLSVPQGQRLLLLGLGGQGVWNPNFVYKSSTGYSFILSLSMEISCDLLVVEGFVCDKVATFSDQIKKALCLWI